MPVKDMEQFLTQKPLTCEYPDCPNPVYTLTHNFDHIDETFHKRHESDWDYIFVCNIHWGKLWPKYNEKFERFRTGANI